MNQHAAFILAVHILNPDRCLFSLINCFFHPARGPCSALPGVSGPCRRTTKVLPTVPGLRPHLCRHCTLVGGGDRAELRQKHHLQWTKKSFFSSQVNTEALGLPDLLLEVAWGVELCKKRRWLQCRGCACRLHGLTSERQAGVWYLNLTSRI